MDPATLFASVAFGCVGLAAWQIGRRRESGRHMFLGACLMGYTFLVPDGPWWAWGTGAVLTAACFLG